jgi:acyl-CoA dehydrogenase
MIKVAAPNMALRSSTGRSRSTAAAASRDDFPLAAAVRRHQRTLRLADGPDEVHM